MPIIKLDKPGDALYFDGLLWQIPSVHRLQCYTGLLHPMSNWAVMYWSCRNLFTFNWKRYPKGQRCQCRNIFVTNGLQVRGCLLVARVGICLDITHGCTVVRASLVAKFQWSRILIKWFTIKNSAPPPPPFLICLSPFYWGQRLWSDLHK